MEHLSKNLLGKRVCQKLVKDFAHVAAVLRVSVSSTQPAIFVEVVEEEWPTQMCGHIIKSFNLSMPDQTGVCGQIIKGSSLSEPIYNLFLSLLHPFLPTGWVVSPGSPALRVEVPELPVCPWAVPPGRQLLCWAQPGASWLLE